MDLVLCMKGILSIRHMLYSRFPGREEGTFTTLQELMNRVITPKEAQLFGAAKMTYSCVQQTSHRDGQSG